jgi:hypothetical protein
MKCNNARILISASVDGELSPKEQFVLDRHVSLCTECAREKAAVSGLRGAMALWTDEEPSEWLAQSFSHKLGEFMEEKRAPQPAPRRRFGVFAPAGLAAAALLIVMLVHNRVPTPAARVPVKSHEVATTSGQVRKSDTRATDNGKAEIQIAQGDNGSDGERNLVRHPGHRRHPRPVHVAMGNAEPVTPTVAPAVPPPGGSIADDSAVSGVAPSAAANEIKYNIGEAGIAMNESMERLRGTLQEAVDLVVSKPPMPARDTEPVGGNIP